MYSIRKYKPSDRDRLRYICKETVFDGNKENKKRLESIAIIYNDYYTQYEPQNIFVAVNEKDIPVGYIICSSDIRLYKNRMLKEYGLKVAKTYPGALYIFAANLFSVAAAGKKYGVHLHIDLLPEAQHKGLGSTMIKILSAELYKRGINNLSVCGINLKSDAYNFYRHLGFTKVQDLAPGFVTLSTDTKKTALR